MQGDNLTCEPGTNTIFVMTHEETKNIQRHIKSSHMPEWYQIIENRKKYPFRIIVTAGVNLLRYDSELTTLKKQIC